VDNSEFDYISWIKEQTTHGENVLVGIGDDASVIDVGSGRKLVVTTDTIIEGVHCRRDDGAVLIGRKALAVSVSDLAAMGCPADYCVIAATLTKDTSRDFADDIYRGIRSVADVYKVDLVGGDVTTGEGPLSITTTVFGIAEGLEPVLRTGSRVGDAICVTGSLGGSLRGKHLRFEPRLTAGIELNRTFRVTSMIDISDGLVQDLAHLIEHRAFHGADIFAEAVPVSDDARALEADDGKSALDHALHDGEDFELCFTCSETVAQALVEGGVCGVPVSRIGTITDSGAIRLLKKGEAPSTLSADGYVHRFGQDG
jgi:thiamine-monophosphate kinase